MRILALGLCAFALSAPEALFGQAVYGSISGNVTDSSGAAVPNAKDGIHVTGNSLGGTSDSLVPSVSVLSNVISGNGNNGLAMFGGFKHLVHAPGAPGSGRLARR